MLFLRRAHSPFIKNICKKNKNTTNKKQRCEQAQAQRCEHVNNDVNNEQAQRCEHRIMKNKQIKSTVHDANKKMK